MPKTVHSIQKDNVPNMERDGFRILDHRRSGCMFSVTCRPADEARRVSISRAEDGRRGACDARRGRPDDGRVLAGGQSLVPIMAFRLARPTHLVDINGVDGAFAACASRAANFAIGACVRHAAFHRPVVRRAARGAPARRRAAHRALSDPHARHILRQPRACRPGVRMVPGGGGARRRDGRAQRARSARRSRRRSSSRAS